MRSSEQWNALQILFRSFTGDLIDEGSEATREEFDTYADRFLSLFPPKSGRTTVYLPGDNDIGGEGVDPVTLDKISRFEHVFGPAKPIYNIREATFLPKIYFSFFFTKLVLDLWLMYHVGLILLF